MYQDMVDRLQQVTDERSVAYADVYPGGKSGLLVRRVKTIGSGSKTTEVEEYVFDRAILSERREYLKQAAIEAGDWEDKQAHRIVQPTEDLSDRTTEELFAEQAILNEAIDKIEAMRAGNKPLEIAGSCSEVEET
jgi:hypothetical protein